MRHPSCVTHCHLRQAFLAHSSAGGDTIKFPGVCGGTSHNLAHLADLRFADILFLNDLKWVSPALTSAQQEGVACGNHLNVGKLDELLSVVVPPVVWFHMEHSQVAALQA